MLVLPNPTQLRLYGYDQQRPELEQRLKYVDQKLDYELRSFKRNRFFAARHGQQAYEQRLAALTTARNKTLLFEDEQGMWTYSGLAHSLAEDFGDPVDMQFQRPSPRIIPWSKVPDRQARYYQVEAKEKLLALGHAGVEIGTGLGKSFIILNLCKELGLKSVVMAPSVNIAEQL